MISCRGSFLCMFVYKVIYIPASRHIYYVGEGTSIQM